MSGKPELDAALADLASAIKNEIASATTIITAMTDAFNRLLQKIAEGAPDLQGDIDQIKVLKSNLDDANAKLVSAISQANVEGA